MQKINEKKLLRIFVSSTDRISGELIHEKIVTMAKNQKLAGATVFRGILGFGASSVIHTSKFWELTEKLPLVIEIIDQSEKVELFYKQIEPILQKMPKGCLVTLDPVNVVLYKSGTKKDSY
ncbi:MAG: DUF190 domain-containing protein [Bacteroidales bacterium]|jgi:PII-like signaling protein|nr:DUF190 domain-containing protein [Bacteroidales bacterium]